MGGRHQQNNLTAWAEAGVGEDDVRIEGTNLRTISGRAALAEADLIWILTDGISSRREEEERALAEASGAKTFLSASRDVRVAKEVAGAAAALVGARSEAEALREATTGAKRERPRKRV